MPFFEIYRGSRRPVLPLREGEPVNRVDRESNWTWFETRSEAERVAYIGEHKMFSDHEKPHHCPRCGDE